LGWMTHRDPFQSLTFCYSVKKFYFSMNGNFHMKC